VTFSCHLTHDLLDSPRIWVSTNPWKTTATFNAISSTKDEYLKAIEELKKDAPSKKPKMTKLDLGHHSLIDILEKKLEDIEAEFAVRVSYQVPLDALITITNSGSNVPGRKLSSGIFCSPKPRSEDLEHAVKPSGQDTFIMMESAMYVLRIV
jgi:hypothetical protein